MIYRLTESAAALADALSQLDSSSSVISDQYTLLEQLSQSNSERNGLTTQIAELEENCKRYKSNYSKIKQDRDNLSAEVLQLRNRDKRTDNCMAENQTLKSELAQARSEIVNLESRLQNQSVTLEDLYQITKSILKNGNPGLFSSPKAKTLEVRVSSPTQGYVYVALERTNENNIRVVSKDARRP